MKTIQLSHHHKGVCKLDLRCRDCKGKNLRECWHCFECCEVGHTARFCPKNRETKDIHWVWGQPGF